MQQCNHKKVVACSEKTYKEQNMKNNKKKKFRTVSFGKPSLSDLSKPDADAFYKSLLEIILDFHKQKGEEI